MCGIFGTTIKHSIKTIESKMDFLNKRGPDYRAFEEYNHITLGHTRLSIIDLEKRSNQPFNYEYLSIVFNVKMI